MTHEFWFENAHDAYLGMTHHLIANGEHTAPRGQQTIELRNVVITVQNPTDVLLHGMGRKMNDGLAAIEALQLIGGFSDPDMMVTIAPNTAAFMDDGRFHGAYGPRISWQMQPILERLKADRDTRQAIAQIWDPGVDLIPGKHDYPCTIYIQWVIRNGELCQTTHMRSNDLHWGWTYDVVQFTMLQNTVARFLGLPTGPYRHYVDSLHMYMRDHEAIFNVSERPVELDVIHLEGLWTPANADGDWREVQAFADDIAHYPELWVGNADPTVSWLARSIQKKVSK